MLERVPAGQGQKDHSGYPLTVLPGGFLLNDRYRIEKFHKLGGMSLTYLAKRGDHDVLIKEVPSSESRAVISLNQERCTLERLNHPGVVKSHDLFEEQGHYYLVLDFVHGQSLDTLVSPFPDTFLGEAVVLDWALQLCEIFEYLHGQRPPVIYRDLKPKNVIKNREGKLVLVDFGIARVFKEDSKKDTAPMGSAITASPEHYGMAQTDARSDIYTIGATLHYLLSNGRGPEEPFNFAPIRQLNPKVSQRLEGVIIKALSLSPEERYQTVGEMRQALLNSRMDPLPTMEPLGRERSPAREETRPATQTAAAGLPNWALAMMTVLVVLLAVSLGFVWKSRYSNVVAAPLTSPSPAPSTIPEQTNKPRVGQTPVVSETQPPLPIPKPEFSHQETHQLAVKPAAEPRRPVENKPSTQATKRPRLSLGGGPSYPTAEQSSSSPAPEKTTSYPTVEKSAPYPPVNRKPASQSRVWQHPLFEVTLPEGFHEVGPGPGGHEFRADNPPRNLALRIHQRPEARGRGPAQIREEMLRAQGVPGLSIRMVSQGQLRMDYIAGPQTVRETWLKWPDRPFIVHFIYRAPRDSFLKYAPELTSMLATLKLR